MRVGIFDPYLDDLGGGEKYMMTIAKCLLPNNSVTVFWDKKDDLNKVSERFSLDLKDVRIKSNIFSAKYSLPQRLKETIKYDVIIFLSDGSIPWVLSKKLFIHIQQPLPLLKQSSINSLKKARVTAFFCNSVFTKSYIDKAFKVESKVIYPPVDDKSKRKVKENIILTVGRFRVVNVDTNLKGENENIFDYKKQGVMLNVFKDMVKKGLKGWKLIIATSVNSKEMEIFESFKKEAQGFPIEFLVNQNNSDLWDVYSKAKIYWHASGFGEDLNTHPEFAEHFGISTVEAMSAGAVPVVINAGGQKEIVQDGENGLLWITLEELKSKTLKLIEDPVLLKKLLARSMLSSQKYSEDKFCKEINEMILE